ncbi:MAG: polysaccharide biosynthesis/export family protein [Cytophagales bacterium]|nr:polysaccharide biosynthesis/export family protein [Cytophagales bacterium]
MCQLKSTQAILLVICCMVTACVPNRHIKYLQKPNKENFIETDSVVRQYQLPIYTYKLQPQDQVAIQFESLTSKDFDFLNGRGDISQGESGLALAGKVIDAQGEVSFPFLEKVKIAGMSIDEAEAYLQKIVAPYLDSPIVRIKLLNFRVTFLGEVIKEGTIPMNDHQVPLLEAIGWAGGLTDFAKRDEVKVIRTVAGRTTVQYINLLDENFLVSPYYYVHPHDVIIVPPLKTRPYLKYASQNTVLIVTAVNVAFLIINLTRSN